MGVVRVIDFQTQEQAVEHLEKKRWNGFPICPYCGTTKVYRHASGDRASQRWQCENCSRAFSVTVGTIFQGTHVPLKQWFILLSVMLRTENSATASGIARDLNMRRATVGRMMQRIRSVIHEDREQSKLLRKIVSDEGDRRKATGSYNDTKRRPSSTRTGTA
jgi:transposase-like protein